MNIVCANGVKSFHDFWFNGVQTAGVIRTLRGFQTL